VQYISLIEPVKSPNRANKLLKPDDDDDASIKADSHFSLGEKK
jgi:hypothetical protein